MFYENYLGTLERSITLNFSKPATNIIAQASSVKGLQVSRRGHTHAEENHNLNPESPRLGAHNHGMHSRLC